jgi:RNA polymerase sigma factor (sigma-70 family)
MELRQVRYFVTIAETGSYTRAAELLTIAQPSLSQQIAKLEDELGVRLFDRTSRGIVVTAAGAAFLIDARAMLDLAERARSSARRAGSGTTGTLTIGYARSTPFDLLTDLDVFVKLWTKPTAFRGGDLGAWLARVTRNRARDILRSHCARRNVELPGDFAGVACLTDDVFARIDHASVRRAVAALEPAHRELLLLAYFGGLTQVELARRTGLPLGTVKTRMRTALRTLRERLLPELSAEYAAS